MQDRGVSGAHSCLIVEPDNSFTLVDIGSTTGTWLFRNGDWEPVVQAPVSTTDRIRIGPFETTVAELLLRLQERPDNQQSPRQKLFMSYRRADTEQVSGRIFDYLAERYGSEHVFFDTEAIPGAVDFRARIRTAMNESFAALAIIGSKWNRRGKLQTMLSWLGRQPDADHVVVEIEMAIMGRVPIVPLLAGDATMPSSKDLPAFGSIDIKPQRVARPLGSGLQRRYGSGCVHASEVQDLTPACPKLALLANPPRCNEASAAEGRPAVVGVTA